VRSPFRSPEHPAQRTDGLQELNFGEAEMKRKAEFIPFIDVRNGMNSVLR
jgi:hypothetical protein